MKYKIAIEETYIREFEVDAGNAELAEEKAAGMWRRNDDGLPEARFTHADIMIDDGSWNELADYQPWIYTPVYVVEWGDDENPGDVGSSELSEFIDALKCFREINLSKRGEWKYLQVDYVDNDGNYHPEMNYGLIHEQYEEEK